MHKPIRLDTTTCAAALARVASGKAKRTASALVFAVLACVAAPAFALTYEENIDDNPDISTALRLERLAKHMDKQLAREREIREEYSAIQAAIEPGKVPAAGLPDLTRRFRAAADSRTVSAAVGDGTSRGLAWYCSRAKEILSQFSVQAGTASRALEEHASQLASIPVGTDNAVATLQVQFSLMQSAVSETLDSETSQRMRSDLRQIELGLPHAFGSYTTLRQMAEESNEKSTELLRLAVRLRGHADSATALVKQYLDEQQLIGKTLNSIQPEYASDVALRDSIRARWSGSVLPGEKSNPLGIAGNASDQASQWQTLAEDAQSAVREGMRPFPEAVGACGDWKDPARNFADARAAASRPLAEPFINIDQAYAARSAELRQLRGKAEDIRRIDQETVSDLDRKIGGTRTTGARLDEAKRLRSEAQQEISRMEGAITAYDSESRVVDEQRPAMTAMKTKLLAAFSPAGE